MSRNFSRQEFFDELLSTSQKFNGFRNRQESSFSTNAMYLIIYTHGLIPIDKTSKKVKTFVLPFDYWKCIIAPPNTVAGIKDPLVDKLLGKSLFQPDEEQTPLSFGRKVTNAYADSLFSGSIHNFIDKSRKFKESSQSHYVFTRKDIDSTTYKLFTDAGYLAVDKTLLLDPLDKLTEECENFFTETMIPCGKMGIYIYTKLGMTQVGNKMNINFVPEFVAYCKESVELSEYGAIPKTTIVLEEINHFDEMITYVKVCSISDVAGFLKTYYRDMNEVVICDMSCDIAVNFSFHAVLMQKADKYLDLLNWLTHNADEFFNIWLKKTVKILRLNMDIHIEKDTLTDDVDAVLTKLHERIPNYKLYLALKSSFMFFLSKQDNIKFTESYGSLIISIKSALNSLSERSLNLSFFDIQLPSQNFLDVLKVYVNLLTALFDKVNDIYEEARRDNPEIVAMETVLRRLETESRMEYVFKKDGELSSFFFQMVGKRSISQQRIFPFYLILDFEKQIF
jgi:hypothetical protein